jgi:hypothetical protein
MKRILVIALALASLAFGGLTAEAKTTQLSRNNTTSAANVAGGQWQRDRWGRRVHNQRRARTFTRSRIVHFGRRVYRETYLVRAFANGRTDTQLISRVRIG